MNLSDVIETVTRKISHDIEKINAVQEYLGPYQYDASSSDQNQEKNSIDYHSSTYDYSL